MDLGIFDGLMLLIFLLMYIVDNNDDYDEFVDCKTMLCFCGYVMLKSFVKFANHKN